MLAITILHGKFDFVEMHDLRRTDFTLRCLVYYINVAYSQLRY